MQIYIKIKQLGKKKATIERQPLVIPSDITDLRGVITNIVEEQVKSYNKKSVEPELVDYLLSSEIESKAKSGKIGFGRRYNDRKAKREQAIENALISFDDCLYRVFVNDEEIETLDEKLTLKEEDELTFIRLVMLAGRLW